MDRIKSICIEEELCQSHDGSLEQILKQMLSYKKLYNKDVEHSLILKPSNFCIPPDYPVGKEEFLDGLRELHIGEWRSNYDPRRFGYEVLNGTQWELEIFFSDGHKPMKICGSNSYPYNFNKFLELLGIEPMEGEEDTDDE